jgi:hypothetical protein
LPARLVTDDDTYFAWLAAHPEGFQANMTSTFSPGYFTVHKATCFQFRRGSMRNNGPGVATQNSYRKVVGPTRSEVVDWGLRRAFRIEAFHLCQHCFRGEQLEGRQLEARAEVLASEPPSAPPPPRRPLGGGGRGSADAYAIGRAGEGVVFEALLARAPLEGWTAVRWVADAGETPGWDIEYRDADGVLQAVEVKATTAEAFGSLELTANEWAQAQRLADRYWLLLVTDVRRQPRVEWVQNPARQVTEGRFALETTGVRLRPLDAR